MNFTDKMKGTTDFRYFGLFLSSNQRPVQFLYLVACPPSFDFPDAEGFYSDRMHVPQTITIPDVGDDHTFVSGDASRNPQGSNRFDMTSSMSIPERIVVNQAFETPSSNSVRRNLTDDAAPIPGGGMGGMITPPRTLTVDDTASAYYPRGRPTTANARAANESRTNRDLTAGRVDADVESLSAGLEMINEVSTQDSESESEFAPVDVQDIRKCVIQVRHLSRQVRELEREVDRASFGFWSKMMFFAFTIINPLILNWLFLKKR